MRISRRLSTIVTAVAMTAVTGMAAFALEGDTPAVEEDTTTVDDTVEDDTTVADEHTNHGQIVSEFAQTTELTGCARGQAVSAVARGLDAADARPCTDEDEVTTDEDDTVDSLSSAADSSGKGNGKGKPRG